MGGYSESSGSLNVITRVLIRKKGGRRLRTRGDVIKGSRDQSAVGNHFVYHKLIALLIVGNKVLA